MLAQRKVQLTRIPLLIIGASGQSVEARFIATELTDSGLDCFVNTYIARGAAISLNFETPQHGHESGQCREAAAALVLLKGLVTSCYLISRTTRVLGQDSYPYRVGLRFQLESQTDRDALLKFRAALYSCSPG